MKNLLHTPTLRKTATRMSVAVLAVAGLGLSSCGSSLPGLPDGDTQDQGAPSVADLPMKATDSPQAQPDDVAGSVARGVFADADVKDGNTANFRSAAFGPLGDNAHESSQSIGVLAGSSLLIASPGDAKARSVSVPDDCTDIATSGAGVALACGSSLIEYTAEGKEARKVDTKGTVRSGTFTADGLGAYSTSDSDKVYFFDAEGKTVGDDIVSKDLDRSVLVQPHDGSQRVAMIDRTRTSINDVAPTDKAYNAALRIGQGVGQVAASASTDGVVVASDTRQDQLLIYTMNDVVRLHQSTPTGHSPFAVAWDSQRNLAWVSTTADNTLTAYDITTGVPVAVADMATLGNIAAVYPTADRGLVLLSKNGDVQTIEASAIDTAVKKNADKPSTQYPVKKIAGE
ncbi:hypothetical protein GC425_00465 [Corynebacterium sp. zg254]|uniref:WD40 repeat protein n=1 Tax=Corynebacterium zhongnanshanii TaxID=2768834 RepID=A0ABQ6VI93_9CORY|nr:MULTISPECIES: hypothetical protein [Corynebacterium]KAB3523503.1 hypothetical protein F8377_05165 [Corynebacterium zhongnanshanii]MCR5913349.1 hypothetical protein [Corynebacterium sp. zg254]